MIDTQCNDRTLVVGFDSAWGHKNLGAIVGAVISGRSAQELGRPSPVKMAEAIQLIEHWKESEQAKRTLILVDHPVAVINQSGQRDVENIVASCVSRAGGGVQSSNLGPKKKHLFDTDSPIGTFNARYGSSSGPTGEFMPGTYAIETFPALYIISREWTRLPGKQGALRLPKYNPSKKRKKNGFSLVDWEFLCGKVADELAEHGLNGLNAFIREEGLNRDPRKAQQDALDSCICLLAGVHLARSRKTLMVGKASCGSMVVPHASSLEESLGARCKVKGWDPAEWIAVFEAKFTVA